MINKKKIYIKLIQRIGKWEIPPSWVKEIIDNRKIYKSPFIKSNWEILYDKTINRLVIPWTDEYYQLRAITKKQEEENRKIFISSRN